MPAARVVIGVAVETVRRHVRAATTIAAAAVTATDGASTATGAAREADARRLPVFAAIRPALRAQSRREAARNRHLRNHMNTCVIE
jgi:hypothetical protein